MRIIDSNTGIEPEIGVPFTNVNGTLRLLIVRERLLSAEGFFELVHHDGRVEELWVPLQVRFSHPMYFFQKVAFIPS